MAKKALGRKKKHQETRDQTDAHINTLETQISAIESANINVKTLQVMQAAASAMQVIHHNLTPEKVDETMYATPCLPSRAVARGCSSLRDSLLTVSVYRDKLRDQNELSNEVMNAITSNPLGQEVDEAELDAELDELQQERLSEQILTTGNVPTSDAIHRKVIASGKQRMLRPPLCQKLGVSC